MKKTVLVYGLIAGILCGGMLLSGVMTGSGDVDFDKGMYFGFTGMTLSAIIIWFGMASYKKNYAGGQITFGKAFQVGALTALVASSIYVFTWMAGYNNIFAGFGEKYTAYQIENMKKMGKSDAEVQAFSVETRKNMEQYDSNAVYRAAVTYVEILPLQLFVVLIASIVISRKKKAKPEFSFTEK